MIIALLLLAAAFLLILANGFFVAGAPIIGPLLVPCALSTTVT